jgi:hypothetical protein
MGNVCWPMHTHARPALHVVGRPKCLRILATTSGSPLVVNAGCFTSRASSLWSLPDRSLSRRAAMSRSLYCVLGRRSGGPDVQHRGTAIFPGVLHSKLGEMATFPGQLRVQLDLQVKRKAVFGSRFEHDVISADTLHMQLLRPATSLEQLQVGFAWKSLLPALH